MNDQTYSARTVADLGKFFITGMGKSGSTWLQMLLNSHPEIVCLGEGQLFAHYPPHLANLGQAHNQAQNFLRNKNFSDPNIPDYPILEDDDLIAILRYAVNRVFSKFPITDQTKLVGDKSPQNSGSLDLISLTFPEAKIIHISRDPRDVVISSWHHWKRVKPQALEDMFQSDIKHFAQQNYVQWFNLNRTVLEFQKANPEKAVMTTYEAMSMDPEKELVRVVKFLGADSDKELVRACVEANQFEKLSGGRKPGVSDNARFFRRGIPGAWRDEMSEGLSSELPADVRELMAGLGYGD